MKQGKLRLMFVWSRSILGVGCASQGSVTIRHNIKMVRSSVVYRILETGFATETALESDANCMDMFNTAFLMFHTWASMRKLYLEDRSADLHFEAPQLRSVM